VVEWFAFGSIYPGSNFHLDADYPTDISVLQANASRVP